MIFTNNQKQSEIEYYKKLLKVLGSLSNLFSDSKTPYLNYRISENLFCKSFNAKNLSRSDVSADASKGEIGIGLKTFIEGNGNTFQKVAEFNRDRKLYEGANTKEIVLTVSQLRNKRIEATKRIHKLDQIIYHCVTRKPNKMGFYEVNMDLVQEDSINSIVGDKNTIKFTDGLNDYSFNLSKSTLYKRFTTPNDIQEIDIQVLSDPFDTLENLLQGNITTDDLIFESIKNEEEHVFLPLYSDKSKKVEERSGLNQWNAQGRLRDPNEIYIPIPLWIHREYPDFFPPRDEPFDLILPDGTTMSAKVCQSNGKALMSNPNKALGKWLLRDVLNLREKELLTNETLNEIGLDSVVIYKIGKSKYEINFTKTGTFESFKKEASDKS